MGNLALETETELDDLIVPYLPKLFQTLAIALPFGLAESIKMPGLLKFRLLLK